MLRTRIYRHFLVVVVLAALAPHGFSTEDQCHADCRSPSPKRPVGPTRPWDSRDDLGNVLGLTRPYPYSTAAPIAEKETSPYAKFCEMGCTLFFSSQSEPMELEECTSECDRLYRYNITVGYSDLAEVARLECRDGCQIGLVRCQPGYRCSQVTLLDEDMRPLLDSGLPAYRGGAMTPCPPGSYRDFSYDAVEACLPCPPGRLSKMSTLFLITISCTKCPVGTYASTSGSTSMRDCIRCPAGRFSTEEGSSVCKCITLAACEQPQLPSPADAEKRDTVPYIGRW